jgi:N-glycosylase/DNA lyase
MTANHHRAEWVVKEYDLAATLESGQAFRWVERGGYWEGVVGRRWVRLGQEAGAGTIQVETVGEPGDWGWLKNYLRIDDDLGAVLESFPKDGPMTAAVASCRGLRLLRQDPWECLASFLLSSTKQIPQIREGVRLLCERFGERIEGPVGGEGVFAFPTAGVLAGVTESELRECRIGFRAKYLKGTAAVVARGELLLEAVGGLPLEQARERLVMLPGVGPKIADCVLLFAYGHPRAFPVDVWVMRALRELYFPGRRPPMARLKRFSENHFGPQAGYAQQYLFHHVRMLAGRVVNRRGTEEDTLYGD